MVGMTKPIVWCDVDGVLADFSAKFLNTLGVITNRIIDAADVTDFDMSAVGSPAELAEAWAVVDQTPDFVRHLPAIHDGMEGVRLLRQAGYDVRAATAPRWSSCGWMPSRTAWLLERGFTDRQIVHIGDKSVLRGRTLIDDALHNINAWADANPYNAAFLVNRPWNRSGKISANVIRVDSVRQVVHP